MIWLNSILFLSSCAVLSIVGPKLVKILAKIAKFLNWKEFVVAFFALAFVASLPNFLVGINSALQKIPQLSFGDIVGGNVINLTLAVALAVLMGKGVLTAESKTVQTSAAFCVLIAILPLVLVLDGMLGRIDGLLLLGIFILYIAWLFSKKERFKKVYNEKETRPKKIVKSFKSFLANLARTFLLLALALLASHGIVTSAKSFSSHLGISLPVVGLLIVGLGNALPEIYFGVISSIKKQNWLILGDIMGAIIISATLVLGIVALIHPIPIINLAPMLVARIFLIISALFFFIIVND